MRTQISRTVVELFITIVLGRHRRKEKKIVGNKNELCGLEVFFPLRNLKAAESMTKYGVWSKGRTNGELNENKRVEGPQLTMNEVIAVCMLS